MMTEELVGMFDTESSFEVAGRGTAFAIRIDFPITYKEVRAWGGRRILLDGKPYTIRGVETFMPHEDLQCDRAGILI